MAKGIKHIFTKVAGASFPNDDGSSRQKILGQCGVPECLDIQHDEGNEHDPNAIRVSRNNGDQIGWLPSNVAEQVVREAERGCTHVLFLTEVTGGERGKPTRGANLLLVIAEPGADDSKTRSYALAALKNETGHSGSGCAVLFILFAVSAALA